MPPSKQESTDKATKWWTLMELYNCMERRITVGGSSMTKQEYAKKAFSSGYMTSARREREASDTWDSMPMDPKTKQQVMDLWGKLEKSTESCCKCDEYEVCVHCNGRDIEAIRMSQRVRDSKRR
eukprot:gene1967-4893_t